MFDTVECPYCKHENDMSEGTVDLPSDNKFDHECENCPEEFEVFVEFTPVYSSGKINYESCEKCGKETREFRSRGRTFPFPESLKEDKVCYPCFTSAYVESINSKK